MAKTEFTEDELKNHLFVQFVKRPDGPLAGRTDFHGFFTDTALIRCRNVRNIFGPMDAKSGRMSDYLFFLAELFRESENQAMSAPVALENPCAEIPIEARQITNLKPPLDDHEAGCAINHPTPDSTPHCDCAFGRQFELYRCPRCGATSDAAPFDPPGPSCRRKPCYGRGEA